MENFTGVIKQQLYGCDKINYTERCYREVFILNGKKEGIEKKYINGNLVEEAPYVNGKLHGIEKHYKKDKVFCYVYENDEGVGAYVEFIEP